jgi:putative ABC transport system permease protein
VREWFRRSRRPSDEQFAAEVNAHLAHEIDEQVDRGIPSEEARYVALRRFGNVTRHLERFREASPWFWLDTLWQDVRYGWRSLWRTPILTATVILSLVLAVGTNVAIMTAARTLLLAPLRLPNADRVFFVGHGDQPPASEVMLYGYADDLRRATSDLAVAGLWTQAYFALKYESSVSREMVLVASDEAVRALGFAPRVGRWPSTSEQETGAAVIVLTDWFWRERLGAPLQPLGSRIRVAGMSFTIIGVTPPTFQGFRPAPSFAGVIPAQSCRALGLGDWLTPTALVWRALGRLSPGVSMENVAQRLAHWRLDTLPGAHPLLPPNPPLRVVPARDWIVPLEQQTRLAPVFRGLAATSAVILLLGCANVASALLARSALRRREIAMRIALGAGRIRLVRTLLVEFGLVALLAALGGVTMSRWALATVRLALETHMAHASGFPTASVDFATDGGVLGGGLLLSLLTCAVFSLLPIRQVWRTDPITVLRTGGERHTATARGQRWLLAFQVASSSILVVTALLFVRTVHRALSVELGYSRQGLLLAPVDLGGPQYEGRDTAAMRGEVMDRVRSHPAVEAAGFGSNLSPFSENDQTWRTPQRVVVDGVEHPVQGRPSSSGWAGVETGLLLDLIEPGYREALGLPLLSGRDVTPADGSTGERVALVNEAMARRYWPGRSPIGAQLQLGFGQSTLMPERGAAGVIGVVGSARFDLRRGTAPCVYLARGPSVEPRGGGMLYVRAHDAAAATAWVRDVIRRVAPDEPPPPIQTIEARLEDIVVTERLAMRLLAWFAVAALALSLIGVHGLTAQHVMGRSREIAIRLALGARPAAIASMVGRVALWPILLGTLAGWLGIAVMGPLIARFMFGVRPFDPIAVAGGGVLLMLVALCAAWWPARVAIRTDPAVTLRAE